MVRLAEVFPDEETVYTLCRPLSWSHLGTLIYLDDPSSGPSIPRCAASERERLA
jgi:hypothetical protein